MVSILLLAAAVSSAWACAPDATGGALHSTATFSFTILPPLGWTVATPPGNLAQSGDNATAAAKINSDVESAITLTLLQNSIPTSSVNITINYPPVNAELVTSCATAAAGTYAEYRGTLYYKCGATISMAESSGSITLHSTTPINEGQWKAMAVKVQDNLLPRNVVFQKNLVVSFGA